MTTRFKDFFSDLYKSKTTGSTELRENFFSRITLPQLTTEQIDILETPITIDVITAAVASFARSKSPGSDGLPIEFYSQFSEVLIPKLLKLYNHLFETFTLAPSMREATIILLPKPGKDPGYPESYRPISLLQVDIKIFAKVLSIRLNQVILSLIHDEQVVFMPGRNTSFNLRK